MGKNPEKQFWLWVLLLCVGIGALVGVQVTLFLNNHGAELSELSQSTRTNLLVFLVLAQGSLVPFLVWGMRALYQRYVHPMHRLREDVEALVHGTPNARLAPDHKDPADLAPILNVLMERYQHTEEAVRLRLERATSDLSTEKAHLESLLDALAEGVVVFNQDGGIMRYNRAASSIFGDRPELGIGKPLTGLVDSPVLEFSKEMLEQQLSMGTPHPFVPFHCTATGTPTGPEAGLAARISPLFYGEGVIDGYLLTVEPEDSPSHIPALEILSRREAGDTEGMTALSSDFDLPLSSMRFVVFDTETTGLDPSEGDEIISIGAIAVMNGVILNGEKFDQLVKPSKSITRSAWKVHGIGDVDLADADPADKVMPAFLRFVGNSVLVAHNAAFDMAFLRKATGSRLFTINPDSGERTEPGYSDSLDLNHPVLDTMLLSAVVHPNQPSHSLDSLLARYGIPVSGRHSALGDALMTAKLLLSLLPQLEARGVHTLGEALKATRRTPLARLSYD